MLGHLGEACQVYILEVIERCGQAGRGKRVAQDDLAAFDRRPLLNTYCRGTPQSQATFPLEILQRLPNGTRIAGSILAYAGAMRPKRMGFLLGALPEPLGGLLSIIRIHTMFAFFKKL